MGYTHYWRQERDFTGPEWANLVATTNHLLVEAEKSHRVFVCHESDDPHRPPQIDEDVIRFNGLNEQGHETFLLTREAEAFTFCKTARKPYDMLVCAVLLVAHHYAPEAITYSSDGDAADWQPAVDFVREVEGLDLAFSPSS